MTKKRVLILCGGKSGEHEVSIISATSVFKALDRKKFEVSLIGIDKNGHWLLPDESKLLLQGSNPKLVHLNATQNEVSLLPFENEGKLVSVNASASTQTIQGKYDVVIPVLHGTNGEDGTIQGLLQLAQIPYVGSGVLGSALCMDKDVAKRVLRDAGLPVVPFQTVLRSRFKKNPMEFLKKAQAEFGFPYFVKPCNLGSSVGVCKVKNEAEAMSKFNEAFLYDSKVLVEKGVAARELECAVLGNHEPEASIVGEIIPNHEFYSYDAKYVDEKGADLKIPAQDIAPPTVKKIQSMAKQAFLALECSGLARVDFFLDKVTQELYINELNTLPGFTPISMYPKLWEASGISYPLLLEKLIDLALERHQEYLENKSTV